MEIITKIGWIHLEEIFSMKNHWAGKAQIYMKAS
jgi:hypothetical protein